MSPRTKHKAVRRYRVPEATGELAPASPASADAVGRWLDGYAWHHFVTLTTGRATSPARLLAHFRDRYVRVLARATQAPIAYVVAAEDTGADHPHLHALLFGTHELSSGRIRRAWRRYGRSTVARYQPSGGAARYVAKHIDRMPDDWAVSRRWPPRVVSDPVARVG